SSGAAIASNGCWRAAFTPGFLMRSGTTAWPARGRHCPRRCGQVRLAMRARRNTRERSLRFASLNPSYITTLRAMRAAAAGRRVIAAVAFHFAALAVHVARPRPIGERVIRTGLVAALRHGVENAVDAEHLLAAARVA